MKRGQIIKIYQDPMTETDFEGSAKLIKKLGGGKELEMEMWLVKFENGDIVERWIKEA